MKNTNWLEIVAKHGLGKPKVDFVQQQKLVSIILDSDKEEKAAAADPAAAKEEIVSTDSARKAEGEDMRKDVVIVDVVPARKKDIVAARAAVSTSAVATSTSEEESESDLDSSTRVKTWIVPLYQQKQQAAVLRECIAVLWRTQVESRFPHSI